jgi:hypothetical protein
MTSGSAAACGCEPQLDLASVMSDSLPALLAKDIFYFVEERGVPFGRSVFDFQ